MSSAAAYDLVVTSEANSRNPDLSLRWSEMFAHNEIEINAPLGAVWNHLVQAKLWPQWFPDCGNVKIKDGSQVLQKNTKFTWSGFDLPRYNRFESFSPPLDSKVVEYVPESRIGWVSYATSIIYGLFVIHTMLGFLPQPMLKSAR